MARSRTPQLRGAPALSSSLVLLAAMLLTATAAALILLRHPRIAGAVALLAGAAILWGWFIAHGEATARSRFVSMLVDPLYDSVILASVAWVARTDEPRLAALAIVALGLSYVAAYERARADALGFRTFESVGYRAARIALISIALIADQLTIALWLFISLTGAAVTVRAVNVAMQHRRSKPGRVRRVAR